METIKINIYTFDELSEDAKENAHNNYLYNFYEYFFWRENEASLEKFAEVFGLTITHNGNYQDYYYAPPSFQYEPETDDHLKMTGHRLAKYLWNNFARDIYPGKYYGKLVYDVPVSKQHPIGARHVKRHSKVIMQPRNCVLTGYCVDDDLLDPIYNFIDNPTDDKTIIDLFYECMESYQKSCKSDYEYTKTMEYFQEHAEANDYKFLENGEIY